MKRSALIIMLLIIIGLVGCSSSRVVLLETGKTQNALVVKTAQGEQLLDQPNTFTELSSTNASPSAPESLTPQELTAQYGRLIDAAPKPPQAFLLYFEAGATTLTKASEQLFAAIETAIQERVPCDVNIIGHADRAGAKEYNITLSLQRAQRVQDWLLSRNLPIEKVVVESYGEEDPLIATDDGVEEPRNRRVEILIR